MKTLNVQQKRKIYPARSYRHLASNRKQRWLFLIGFVLPCLTLFLLFYTEISYVLVVWVKQTLSAVIPESSMSIAYGNFLSVFGSIYYLQIPSIHPPPQEIALNLVATILLLFLCFLSLRKSKGGTPLIIYFFIVLLIHLFSCIFFVFAKDYFPYSLTEYSQIYIQQQVSIWLSILTLSGLITGYLGYGSMLGRLLSFLGTMMYSFIFGFVRFFTFMFILSKVSSLYMATLLFSVGPLFDFLYLVSFYTIYLYSQYNSFNEGEGSLKWYWL